MANYYYIFTENYLHQHQNEEQMSYFLQDTGFSFDEIIDPILTINSFKEVLSNTSIQITSEKWERKFDRNTWIVKLEQENCMFLDLEVIYSNENEPSIEYFHIDYISDLMILCDIFSTLSKQYGKLLFYCDSGEITLISKEKEPQDIYAELL